MIEQTGETGKPAVAVQAYRAFETNVERLRRLCGLCGTKSITVSADTLRAIFAERDRLLSVLELAGGRLADMLPEDD
jgi:hypothetical protein